DPTVLVTEAVDARVGRDRSRRGSIGRGIRHWLRPGDDDVVALDGHRTPAEALGGRTLDHLAGLRVELTAVAGTDDRARRHLVDSAPLVGAARVEGLVLARAGLGDDDPVPDDAAALRDLGRG